MASQLDRIESNTKRILEKLETGAQGGIHPLPGSGQGGGQSGGQFATDVKPKTSGRSGLQASGLSPADQVFMRWAQENAMHHLGPGIAARGGPGMEDIYKALLVGSDDDMKTVRSAHDQAHVQQSLSDFRASQNTPGGGEKWISDNVSPALVSSYHQWLAEQRG